MIFKGVKKIQPIQGKILEEQRFRNFSKIIIPADEWVVFTVSEWEPMTTSEQKKGDLVWVLLSEDRKKILNQLVSRSGYRVQIPRSLCGETCFYVDAYLHNPLYQQPVLTVWDHPGLHIQGRCEPGITGSLWKETSNGTDDIRRTRYFSFGEMLYLELLTEGLNGSREVTVELYCLTGDSPDQARDILMAKTTAPVKEGRLQATFASSYRWMQTLYIQNEASRNTRSFRFYVRVPARKGSGYVADTAGRTYHANYVQLYNQVKAGGLLSPIATITATKIGSAGGNLKKYEHCKFSKIIAYEDGKITDIFNEEALVKMYTDKDRFETSRQVHYEFNSYQLSKESFAVLDELAKLLREMPFVPVEIGGHTDSRGSDAYNQILSERRAKSVMDYLIDQGIHPGRIRARGYGKREPLYREEQMPGGACEEKMLTEQEKKLREPLHHENRRTTIRFLVNGNNAQTLVMEIMAPSHEHPKEYRIKTVEEKHSRCLKAQDRHTLEKKVVEFSQFHAGKVTLKEGVEISYPVHSVVNPGIKEQYFSYLLQYLAPGKEPVNRYFFHMHSCAYYSSKNQPTVLLKVFPDLVWIGHFQYNFYEINEKEEKAAKKDYFFHNHRVVLQNGMDTLVNAVSKKISTLVFRLIPPSWISENVIVRYLREQASDYDYGLHLIHNRKIENPGERLSLQGTPTDLLTETRYPKYAAAYVVYLLVLTQILIELLLIYLTRGRNLKGKVARLARRYKRFKKFMDDNNLSLIAPSIALNGGMYYYMDRHRKMGLMYELNIKAEPLVEIHFRQEFDLLNDFLNSGGKEGNAQVAALLKKAGFTTVKGNFDADGILAFEDSLRYHLLTNKYSAGERMLHLFSLGHNERLVDGKIDLQVKLNFEYKNEFEFLGINSNIEGKVDFDFNGGAGLKLRYGTSPQKGLFMELILIFSGVKGIFSGNLKTESLGGLIKTNYSPNKGKPIPFTLLEAKEYSLCKIYLFDPNP